MFAETGHPCVFLFGRIEQSGQQLRSLQAGAASRCGYFQFQISNLEE
jgi:hypothetical protein